MSECWFLWLGNLIYCLLFIRDVVFLYAAQKQYPLSGGKFPDCGDCWRNRMWEKHTDSTGPSACPQPIRDYFPFSQNPSYCNAKCFVLLVFVGGRMGGRRESDWCHSTSTCGSYIRMYLLLSFLPEISLRCDAHRVWTCVQVAARVAEERGAFLGHEVGYTIRFDDCSDPQATRIKVGSCLALNAH